VLRHPEVHGGSGFAASTVGDMGFEPTLGATSPDAKPRRAREGLSAAGVLATVVSGACASAGDGSDAAAKLTRRKKGNRASSGALLTLIDLGKMHGQPEPDRRAKITVKAEGGSDRAVGCGVSGGAGSSRSKRNVIVCDVMNKHGLSLPRRASMPRSIFHTDCFLLPSYRFGNGLYKVKTNRKGDVIRQARQCHGDGREEEEGATDDKEEDPRRLRGDRRA
jgi:hypothetical protein